MQSRKLLPWAVLIGVGFLGVIGWLLRNDAEQKQTIRAQQDTILELRSRLEGQAAAPEAVRPPLDDERAADPVTRANGHAGTAEKSAAAPATPGGVTGSLQILRELEGGSDADPRSALERLQELLSGSANEENAAIASRFVFDKAGDAQALPDYALQSLYATQSNADLRRVIAQVLSQRGNDSLLNDQIAGAQSKLMSTRPGDRQQALAQLARMHSTRAVDAIAPFLQDPDTTVRLEALFALRDTGNQQHVSLVAPLVNDPDPSVRTLAADVASSLKNMSSSARTSYSRSDIEAELPPIANP